MTALLPPLSVVPAAKAQSGLDIRSFGARCDGSDDTGAVQAAINALQNGGTLTFSCVAGVTGVELNTRSNITLAGSNGGGLVLISDTGEAWARALLVQNCTNCTIRDLVLDGNRKNYVPTEFRYNSNTTVRGLSIRNVGRAGTAFLAFKNNGNKYLNNTIQSVDVDRSPGQTDTARGMIIGGVSSDTQETNVTVSGNNFSDISATALVAQGSGMTISGNIFTRLNWSCIKVIPLGGTGSTLIENNNCSGAGGRWLIGGGIMTEYFTSSSEATVIRNNTLEGYGADDVARIPYSPSVGINIANAAGRSTRNIQILNNTIRNMLFDSIQITSTTDNFVIAGNLIERTIPSGTLWTGISLIADNGAVITNGVIRGNVVRGRFDGIRLGGSAGVISGVTVDGNSMVSLSRDGLHIEVSGAQVSASVGSNCYSAIGHMTIYDNRSGGLTPAALSSSCSETAGASTSSSTTSTTSTSSTTSTTSTSSTTSTTSPITSTTTGSATTGTATTSSTTNTVVRVNAGGPAYTDPSGNSWSADFGFDGGSVDSFGQSISGTATPLIYATGRWANRNLTYRFNVVNGTYTVTLKFAELYFTRPGQRVFSVTINGQTVLTNFDIVGSAGGPQRAIDRSFPVSVTNGQVTISLNSSVDDPEVNAIEIR